MCVCVRIVSVLIWNQHPNIRVDDPIIRGSDLHRLPYSLKRHVMSRRLMKNSNPVYLSNNLINGQ